MNRSLKTGCIAVSLAALVLGGGVWWTASRHAMSTSADANKASSSGTLATFSWKRGTRYFYDFQWSVRSTSQFDVTGSNAGGEATTASATSTLAGKLVLESYGKRKDDWLLGVSIEGIREATLSAMGNDVFGTPNVLAETFDDRKAFIEVGSNGEIKQLRFHASDPALFKQLLQSVVAETQVVLTDAARSADAEPPSRWPSIESFSVGKIEMAYAVAPFEPLVLHRTPQRVLEIAALPSGSARGRKAELGGKSDVQLDDEGYVRSIASSLDVKVPAALDYHSEFTMTFESKSAFDAADSLAFEPTDTQTFALDARPEASELRARMDEHFARRTTMAEIDGMIDAHGNGLSPARGMLNSTAAFIRLHPEACDQIATRFLDPATTARTREFMMGLLASAGSPAAQSAMRRALDFPESRSDVPTFGRMIQRFGFVGSPTNESIDYVVALYDAPSVAGDAGLRRVTGLALGSMANHAKKTNRALSDSIHARLLDGLKSSQATTEKIGFVSAVGNVGRESDVALLRKVAKDSEPQVREAVARAMHGMDSDETRGALRELIADPDANVMRAAAQAYSARPLSSSDMSDLATIITSGRLSAGGDASMLGIVQGHMEHVEASEAILESMLAKHPEGAESGKARLLLRRLRGDG